MQDSAQFVQLAQTLCYDLARAEKATDGKKEQQAFNAIANANAEKSIPPAMSQQNQHLTHAMLRKSATTTPKQFQRTWCFGKDGQHALLSFLFSLLIRRCFWTPYLRPSRLLTISTKRKPCLPFQTSTGSCSTQSIGLGSEPPQR